MKTAFLLAFTLLSSAPRYEVQTALPSVVALVDGDRVFCTGFVVADGVVVTAAHCVDEQLAAGEHFVTARFVDGVSESLFVLGAGEEDARDFAILVGDTLGVTPLALAGTDVAPGRRCAIVGHGGGSANQAATLCVTEHPTPDGYLELAATAIPGDSGSPVIDMESETVIGVLVRGAFPTPLSFAVWSPKVKAAVEALLAQSRALFPAPPAAAHK